MRTSHTSISGNIIVLMLFCLSFTQNLDGQSDTLYLPEQFLFQEFSPGVVKMKNGDKLVLNLNYNIVTQKVVFKQRKQIFDLTNYQSVDTVYMNQRKFIPYGKLFYEVLLNGPVSLYIQHTGSVRQPLRPAAYGGTTELSSSRYINNIKLGNDVYRMSSDEKLIIESKQVMWIGKGSNLQSVVNKKQILNILSDKKQDLKTYIKNNRTNPGSPEQMISLIKYYNQL